MTEVRGAISTFSRMIEQLEDKLKRETGMKHFLEALNQTQFHLPQLDIPIRAVLIVIDKVMREAEQASEVGWDLKTEHA